MTNLQRPHTDHDQSPWLDNITRRHPRDRTLARTLDQGTRGWHA